MSQPVPSHISSEMVRDFDLFGDPIFADDLHGGIARLAEERSELFYSPANGGCWVVAGRDAAFEVLTDYTLFSSDATLRPQVADESVMVPIGLDPPRHDIYRKVLAEIFSARAMIALEPLVRERTRDMIASVIADGGCDFAKTVAEPLPVLLFMKLMGFPTHRFMEFRGWVLSGLSEPDSGRRQLIWDKVNAVSAKLIEERRAKREDDLISRLIDTPIDGREATLGELQSLCLMLFIAGLDTVTNAMSLMMRHIAIDQPLQATLRDQPDRIPLAVEELLRRYSANTVQRFVARDAEFRGVPLRRGDWVLIHLPAANLDPRHAPDPTAVDIARRSPHLAFGAGVHRCVGAQLARVEMKAMLDEWLRHVPTFRTDPDKSWTYHTGFVFSIDTLPLIWDAGNDSPALRDARRMSS